MRGRRAGRATAAGGAVLALTMLASVPSAGASASCELVRLATEPGSPWGTVTDIAVLDGAPVYYGSYEQVAADGSTHQRAVVWRGLGAQPELVGPGLDRDTAFDLTETGLVNGTSWDPAARRERPWVRDLTTGRLTWVATSAEPAQARDVVARRINSSGAMTGMGARGKGPSHAADALAWDSPTTPPRALPSLGRGATAFGINDQGDRAGLVEHRHLKGDGRWSVYDPTIWYGDGTVRTAARAGIDATVLALSEDGQMAGSTWWGWDPAAGHFEAAYWPSPDQVVALGVLEQGAWSDAFGMDDAGSVVGRMQRLDADSPMASPWGTVEHSFLWQGEQGAVRILPSLHAVATGEADWREWHGTHAAHAVHTGLDQVGAGTHAGFVDGAPVGAPTVFRNASQCGALVETTHGAPAQELEAAREAAQRSAPHGRR